MSGPPRSHCRRESAATTVTLVNLVDIVQEDLAHLRDTWDDELTEGRLRRDSAVLRRLLVEGALGRAWRAAGHRGEPRVPFHDQMSSLNAEARFFTVWASNGGAEHRQAYIAGIRLHAGQDTVHPVADASLPLSRYVDGTVAIAMGRAVKRRDVVAYVANKLGGVHYDERRHEGHVFAALDRVLDAATIGGFSPVHWELLAVGQLLLRSPEISDWLPNGGLPPLPPWGPETLADPTVDVSEDDSHARFGVSINDARTRHLVEVLTTSPLRD
jgi:hypothetical protein